MYATDSPDSSGVKVTFAIPSTVVTVVAFKVPVIVIAFTVNSSGRVPSNSLMVPSASVTCTKSMVISTS